MKKIPENFYAGLFLIIMVLGLFFSEFLIYYNPEARVDLYRMMPAPIFSMIMFELALAGLVAGIASMKRILTFFFEVIHGWGTGDLIASCIFAGAGLTGGGVTIFRWIKYIIVDNYPAFGDNSNNVYAVVGLNTVISLPLAAIVGMLFGFMIGQGLRLFALFIKYIKD